MRVEHWVELAAFGLAIWATLLSIPRPPRLAWERLFKVGLSVLLAGETERELGEGAAARKAWEERVRRGVPWSPLARLAVEKLTDPRPELLPVPALEGERALVEALARLPDPAARYRHLYAEDERAMDELLGDPAQLGQDHDPAGLLGPGAGWDEVAAWSEALQAVLARRLADVVFVLDGLPADLARELGAAVPGLRTLVLPAPPDDPTGPDAVEALFQPVEAALTQDSDRVVLVASGASARRGLAALVEGGGLRDRCLAFLSLGGELQTAAARPWMAEHFDNEQLDTELKRSVPYFSVVEVDPARPLERDWAEQRFPVPPPLPSGRAAVEVVDLGPLHLAALPPRVLARGLLLLLALRLAA